MDRGAWRATVYGVTKSQTLTNTFNITVYKMQLKIQLLYKYIQLILMLWFFLNAEN